MNTVSISNKEATVMAIDYVAIGLRIKIARLKLKMTQEALANQVKLSTVYISNIETGNARMSLAVIIKIANALSVSVDELLCDNVQHSFPVYNKEAQEIFSQCSNHDIRILVDVLKATKDTLERNLKHS